MALTEAEKRELLEIKQQKVQLLEQKLQQRSDPSEERGDIDNALRFLNQGISQVFGLPGDALNFLNRKLGLGEPFPGTEEVKSGLGAVGIRTPEPGETADDPTEKAFEEIGAGVASLLPFGALARVGRGASVTSQALGRQPSGAARVGQEIAETTGRRPALTTGAEALSIAGAGAGRGAGATTENEALEQLGTIAGAFTPAGLAAAPSATKSAFRAGRAAVDPFTQTGAELRVARRVQDLTPDPEAAAQQIQETAGSAVPPAQRTGSRRLVGLQRSLTDRNPQLDEAVQARVQQAQEDVGRLTAEIGGEDTEALQKFAQQRLAQAEERLGQSVKKSFEDAQERLSRIPEGDRAQESKVVRQEVENAFRAARQQESQLFDEVPDVKVPTRKTRGIFQQITNEQGKLSDPANVPDVLKENVGKIDPLENAKELQEFRSRLLQAKREEAAKEAPNNRVIRNLERAQEAVLQDLGAAADQQVGEAGPALRQALDFSRALNERFTQGPIGKLLGFQRSGGPRVRPSETLGRTIGTQEGGAEDVRALLRTAGEGEAETAAEQTLNSVLQAAGNAETRPAIQRFLQATFRLQASNPDGTIQESAARAFLKKNDRVLDEFPELRDNIQNAMRGQRTATRRKQRTDKFTRNLHQKSKSRFGLMIDGPPERMVDRLLRSDDVESSAREMIRVAKKDESGIAEKGLKASFVEDLMTRSESGAIGDAGERLRSGRALERVLKSEPVKKAARVLLTKDERNRLNRIAQELKTLEAGRDTGIPDIGRPLDDIAASALEIPARVAGAQIGGSLGGASAGGSLQTAQIASSRFKSAIRSAFRDKGEEIMTDMVLDDDLFRKMLTRPTSRGKRQEINRRLNAWLGASVLEEAEDAENPPSR